MCFYWSTLASTIFFFFFNDTATTEIYTLSLHDALPISVTQHEIKGVYTTVPHPQESWSEGPVKAIDEFTGPSDQDSCGWGTDRKSTRLNSSHSQISYAVFCLKKKNTIQVAID